MRALGSDILKVEFPIESSTSSDEALWADACAELDEASPVPWALLSAREPFETFKSQLRIACEAGCSGFLAGRATWCAMVGVTGAEPSSFLSDTSGKRLAELTEIALQYGHPWWRKDSRPAIDTD